MSEYTLLQKRPKINRHKIFQIDCMRAFKNLSLKSDSSSFLNLSLFEDIGHSCPQFKIDENINEQHQTQILQLDISLLIHVYNYVKYAYPGQDG